MCSIYMQIENIESIHGYAMSAEASYSESPNLHYALCGKVTNLNLREALFVFQCLDTPVVLSNPKCKYMCLIGKYHPLDSIDGVQQHTIPGGKVLTLIHQGSHGSVEPTYAKLMEEVQKKQLKLRGAPFQIYLNDCTEVKEEDQLTKVCVPIE
ncbi:Transcription_activator effector binding [Hexamita inflata]|uniref:Transcription activator effector binding n=1 Tax=Hexamita inflata TaxID=28002 RepID=A0AA86N7I7_9EUKA|nr:Transcription activator effector binding [Hexamita inflata]